MKKRVYIVCHHHVLKEWYRYRECGMQLLSFDYHTDFRGAFWGKSGRTYPSEQTALYMRKHIAVIRETQRAAVFCFQCKLGWGCDHAREVIGRLEEDRLVGQDMGGGPREIFWDMFPKCL